MQVEQKNIWEDVTRNAKRDNSNRAIAAYQANMPDAGAVAAFGGQEDRKSTRLNSSHRL